MTEVRIAEGKLGIEILGWHKLWSFKNRFEIPLDHVIDVRRAAGERGVGIRFPGTQIPGVITAGTFYHAGKKVFWDVCNSSKTIVIDLRNESFSRLVIDVADPAAVIEQIQRALTAPASRA